MGCHLQDCESLENDLQVEVTQGSRNSMKVVEQEEKSTELDNLEITLEAVPVSCTFTDL